MVYKPHISALEKNTAKDKTENYVFKDIIDNLPEHVYWKNTQGQYLGCNKLQAKDLNLDTPEQIIGKTDYDLSPKDKADAFRKIDEKIFSDGITIEAEEVIIKDGKNTVVLSKKAPIFDENKKIVGLLGVSFDITDRKKMELDLKEAMSKTEAALQSLQQSQHQEQQLRMTTEQLEIENAINKAQLDAHAEFTKMVAQVVHDVTSPITSLRTILQECSELPEKKRIDLRRAAERILDITNNLLNRYRPKKEGKAKQDDSKQPVLLSATLMELLSEKKYQYQDMPIEFIAEFSQESQFAFINVQLSALKRAISNLINNAAHAFDSHPGTVYLKLDADAEWVHIIVQDTGKGMNLEIVNKIKNKIAFTEGKNDGHGIGLTQVMDTLESNFGSINIESTPGKGTTFTITFSRLNAPIWCAEKITLTPETIIIVLDDDPSIHGAWDVRFEPVLQQSSNIRLHHFEVGQEALNFIKTISAEDKSNLLLLTDYELLNQSLNGIDVVKASKLTHAILVTSHYVNPTVCDQAVLLNTKVLPKQLASHIPILITESQKQYAAGNLKIVDAVWLDDDQQFTSHYEKICASNKKKIDMYRTPKELMDNIHIYPKDIPIFLDNNFQEPFQDMAGTEIAKKLHAIGFRNLFLITGDRLNQHDFPDFKVLSKRHFENLLDYL